LPRAFARVHDRHNSPYTASMGISALSLLGVLPFVLAGSDPAVVYAQLAGLGNAGVFILMALVSVAVVVWFRRNTPTTRQGAWATLVAPSIAATAMTCLVVFALVNFDLVVGDSSANGLLLAALAASFGAGLIVAAVMKARRPDDFLKLGGADR
jgi:amino acid transporter